MALTINTNIINDYNGYLLDAKNVKGGFVVVSGTGEDTKENLPAATLVAGTLVYDATASAYYKWSGTAWEDASFGGATDYNSLDNKPLLTSNGIIPAGFVRASARNSISWREDTNSFEVTITGSPTIAELNEDNPVVSLGYLQFEWQTGNSWKARFITGGTASQFRLLWDKVAYQANTVVYESAANEKKDFDWDYIWIVPLMNNQNKLIAYNNEIDPEKFGPVAFKAGTIFSWDGAQFHFLQDDMEKVESLASEKIPNKIKYKAPIEAGKEGAAIVIHDNYDEEECFDVNLDACTEELATKLSNGLAFELDQGGIVVETEEYGDVHGYVLAYYETENQTQTRTLLFIDELEAIGWNRENVSGPGLYVSYSHDAQNWDKIIPFTGDAAGYIIPMDSENDPYTSKGIFKFIDGYAYKTSTTIPESVFGAEITNASSQNAICKSLVSFNADFVDVEGEAGGLQLYKDDELIEGQDDLVDFKKLNGISLLGAGDIKLKTINNQQLLGEGNIDTGVFQKAITVTTPVEDGLTGNISKDDFNKLYADHASCINIVYTGAEDEVIKNYCFKRDYDMQSTDGDNGKFISYTCNYNLLDVSVGTYQLYVQLLPDNDTAAFSCGKVGEFEVYTASTAKRSVASQTGSMSNRDANRYFGSEALAGCSHIKDGDGAIYDLVHVEYTTSTPKTVKYYVYRCTSVKTANDLDYTYSDDKFASSDNHKSAIFVFPDVSRWKYLRDWESNTLDYNDLDNKPILNADLATGNRHDISVVWNSADNSAKLSVYEDGTTSDVTATAGSSRELRGVLVKSVLATDDVAAHFEVYAGAGIAGYFNINGVAYNKGDLIAKGTGTYATGSACQFVTGLINGRIYRHSGTTSGYFVQNELYQYTTASGIVKYRNVEANPIADAADTLTKITIGRKTYSIDSGIDNYNELDNTPITNVADLSAEFIAGGTMTAMYGDGVNHVKVLWGDGGIFVQAYAGQTASNKGLKLTVYNEADPDTLLHYYQLEIEDTCHNVYLKYDENLPKMISYGPGTILIPKRAGAADVSDMYAYGTEEFKQFELYHIENGPFNLYSEELYTFRYQDGLVPYLTSSDLKINTGDATGLTLSDIKYRGRTYKVGSGSAVAINPTGEAATARANTIKVDGTVYNFLPEAYENYLKRVTFVAPTLSFSMYDADGNALSAGTYETGTTFTFSLFNHEETNIDNISGNVVTLYKGSTAITTDAKTVEVATKALDTAITINSSMSFKLGCTDTLGDARYSSTKTFTFVDYAYWETDDEGTAPTSGTKIETLSSFADKGHTFSYIAGNYLYMYTKTSGQTVQTEVLGQWAAADFTELAAVTLTKANGTTDTYYPYMVGPFAKSGSAKYRVK